MYYILWIILVISFGHFFDILTLALLLKPPQPFTGLLLKILTTIQDMVNQVIFNIAYGQSSDFQHCMGDWCIVSIYCMKYMWHISKQTGP